MLNVQHLSALPCHRPVAQAQAVRVLALRLLPMRVLQARPVQVAIVQVHLHLVFLVVQVPVQYLSQ